MKWLLLFLLKLGLVLLVLFAGLLVYLDAVVTSTFAERRYELPARVYARPLELFAGRQLTADDLGYELGLLGYRQVGSLRNPGDLRRRGQRFDIYTHGFRFAGESEPARRVELRLSGNRIASLSDADGTIDLMRMDPVQIGGVYPKHGEDRLLVRLDEVPDTLVAALLAVEDRDFYTHWGFSLRGIARAAMSNVRSGQLVAGGSTITQQLVKNYYLTPERTVTRKLIELLMAVLLDLHFEKQDILEGYINEIFLGQAGPRAIHGFGLAARHYFDTPLDQLGLHQQALLVGMIKGPSLYNPMRNPERARQRRDLVLQVMVDEGVITAEHAAVALAMPLDLNRRDRVQNAFPAYLDLVRRQLRRDYRDEDLTREGLSVFTSFDPLLQRKAERSLVSVLDGLPDQEGLEGAVVVTRPDTGEVAALVGGRDVRYAGFNRALDARRPAGSLLKPAVYLTALEQPERYSLATLLEDSPLSLEMDNGSVWEPRNFDRIPHGEVLLLQALAESYNLATARLGLDVGIESVVDMLDRLGVQRGVVNLPSLTLGAGEFSPLDMAAMYQSIASGGFRMPLRSIRDILDGSGEPLQRYPLEYERTVSMQSVYLLNYALQQVVREGTGKSVYRTLSPEFDVAGKTGTTNDGRDSWFAGFSGDLVAVAWLGRDDNGGTGLTGATGALKVWSRFMRDASEREFGYRMPDNIETHYVEQSTGRVAGEGCRGVRLMPFIEGSVPASRSACRGRDATGDVLDWFRKLLGD